MIGGLGMPELLVILFIVVLIFGPRQLPKFGRSMGDMVREWRGVRKEIESLHDE